MRELQGSHSHARPIRTMLVSLLFVYFTMHGSWDLTDISRELTCVVSFYLDQNASQLSDMQAFKMEFDDQAGVFLIEFFMPLSS